MNEPPCLWCGHDYMFHEHNTLACDKCACTDYDPDSNGEWCSTHREEMGDHDCL